MRFPRQYFDEETNLHYNYFRGYDASTGRYTQADPRGTLPDFSDPQRQVAAQTGVAIPEVSTFRDLNHNYGYANQNPVANIDSTGELVGALIPPVVVGIGLYCYNKGLDACKEKYPRHKELGHPDRALFLQCISSVASVIGRGLGMGTDPLGTASGALGEAAACSNDNQCE